MDVQLTARPITIGPWIKMKIVSSHTDFTARIDTGADLTIIPETHIGKAKRSGRVKVRMASGTEEMMPTYSVDVTIADKTLHLPKVVTTKSAYGLVGMDALEHFDIMITGGVLIIEPV